MRILLQRVRQARVRVGPEEVGSIGTGWLALVGVTHADSEAEARYLAEKTANIRAFADAAGKMNRSILDVGGAVLAVSQFTLYGDCRKGRRPSFADAAKAEHALEIYQLYMDSMRAIGLEVAAGKFGADMEIESVNWGPVTLMLDSQKD